MRIATAAVRKANVTACKKERRAIRKKNKGNTEKKGEKKNVMKKAGNREGKRKHAHPVGALLPDDSLHHRGPMAQMRLAVWRSAMQYAKLTYGVNHVSAGHGATTYYGPRRGEFVRATVCDPAGKFVQPQEPSGSVQGQT